MIEIARAIGGISINGKEYLLDDEGNTMKFENRETAFQFLKKNGLQKMSDEEIEKSFFFQDFD